MQTRKIGSIDVSVIGLGCNNFGWRIDASQTRDVVHAAIDAGITLFDTADTYGETKSEEFLGAAIKGKRDKVVIATKFGMQVTPDKKGAKPAYVRQACEDSLRRLGVDCIDLYQLHTPDAATPIADTLGALAELVAQGKVRELGCSNFNVGELRAARDAVRPGAPRFVSVQNEYSMVKREREREVGALAECEREQLAFLPYFPLAAGVLSGKYSRTRHPQGTRVEKGGRYDRFLTEATYTLIERAGDWAKERGRTLLELAFAWLLAHAPVASVIAGATSPEQVRANAKAGTWVLAPAERAQIDAMLGELGF